MNPKGCPFLEEGINFDLDEVNDCCIMHNDGRGLPVLLTDYHGELIDLGHPPPLQLKKTYCLVQKTLLL